MIAKIIVHGADRAAAIKTMQKALNETGVSGLVNNQEFLSNIFLQKDFIAGKVDTGFIARHESDLLPKDYGHAAIDDLAIAAIYFLSSPASSHDIWSTGDNWRMNAVLTRSLIVLNREQSVTFQVTCLGDQFVINANGAQITAQCLGYEASRMTFTTNGTKQSAIVMGNQDALTIIRDGRVIHLHLPDSSISAGEAAGSGRVTAPMPGRIVTVLVGQGDTVKKDQPLLVMEAMKMEMTIRAGCDGTVDELPVAANDQVMDGALLAMIAS